MLATTETRLTPEVIVRQGPHGYYIVVEPLFRENVRHIGPFVRRDAALIWAKGIAEERMR